MSFEQFDFTAAAAELDLAPSADARKIKGKWWQKILWGAGEIIEGATGWEIDTPLDGTTWGTGLNLLGHLGANLP